VCISWTNKELKIRQLSWNCLTLIQIIRAKIKKKGDQCGHEMRSCTHFVLSQGQSTSVRNLKSYFKNKSLCKFLFFRGLTKASTVGGLGVEDEHLEICDAPLLPNAISSCVIGLKRKFTDKNKDICVAVLLGTLGKSIASGSPMLQKFTRNKGIYVEILHQIQCIGFKMTQDCNNIAFHLGHTVI
jgi:hypothetical protein